MGTLRMERDDDGNYYGEMLDTVRPVPYRERFTNFMEELFEEGSWLESLPRLHDDWAGVPRRQINQLPEPVRDEAIRRHEESIRRGGLRRAKSARKKKRCQSLR